MKFEELRNGKRAKQGFLNYWKTPHGSPVVEINYRKANAAPQKKYDWMKGQDPWWWTMQWLTGSGQTDMSRINELLESYDRHFDNEEFFGHAYPYFFVNFGPGSLAACLTGFLKFSKEGDTSWFELSEPMAWDKIMSLKLDPENIWWKRTLEMTKILLRNRKDRYHVGIPDLGGNIDILASLRTSLQLIEDVAAETDLVLEACWHINKLWKQAYEELYQLHQAEGNDGSSAWMGLWAPQRWYPLQADFSYMISPRHFEKLIAPILRDQCQYLQNSVYHWDGVGEIPHLDLLLAIPELDAIQWVPGANKPQCEDPEWYPLYDRIQKGNKRIVINLPAKDVVGFTKRFNKAGLFLSTNAESPEQAKAMEKELGI